MSGDLPVVGERYQCVELAARGGMGVVYRSLDRVTGEEVAVKVLEGGSRTGIARFLDEASALTQLSHPVVLKYLDHGVEGDTMYIVTEWLNGLDLRARLGKGRLPIDEAIMLCSRITEALTYAHRLGFVHRDIKPGNLFLVGGEVERVKLLDFGVARAAGVRLSLTRTGAVVGSPPYMSPEQARGAGSPIDGRADIFSLGAVLYECLAGRMPFAGDHSVVILAKVLFEEPPPLRSLRRAIPEQLASLVSDMLRKDPAARPSANEVAASLLRVARSLSDDDEDHHDEHTSVSPAERRLVSAVVIRSGRDAPLDVGSGVRDRLTAIAQAHRGRIEHLPSNWSVVVLSAAGAASDEVANAARCALAMRTADSKSEMALVTGYAELTGAQSAMAGLMKRTLTLFDTAIEKNVGMNADTKPGSGIWLDEETASLLDARFEVESGRLIGEASGGDSTRRVFSRSRRFVGRDRELAVLDGILEECLEEPVARAVLLLGRAGIGKSRLRAKFVDNVRDSVPEAAIFTARADEVSESAPGHIVSELLRDGLSAATRTADQIRAQLAADFSDRATEPERFAEFLAELARLPRPDEPTVGFELALRTPRIMADRTLEAWELWTDKLSQQRPLILVIEDVHWGDVASMKLVDSALRKLLERPFLVLATARPSVHDKFPELWSARDVQVLRLGGLSRRWSRLLSRELLGSGHDHERIAQVVDQSRGNPFIIEELCRAGASRIAAPISVLALIQERISVMEPTARRVLRAASIFGIRFPLTGLRHLLGDEQTEQELAEWLDTLERRDLVVKLASSDAGAEFAFAHALVREAAYAMLPGEDSLSGHRRAADWLARQGRGEPARLAAHYEQASELEEAVGWYVKAANTALAADDFDSVIDAVERGVECGARDSDLGLLRRAESEAQQWKGNNSEAAASASEAMGLLPVGGSSWFDAVGVLAMATGALADSEDLVRLGQMVDNVDIGDRPEKSWAVATARVATFLGLHDAAPDLADRLAAKLDDAEACLRDLDPLGHAWVHTLRSIRASIAGEMGEFIELSQAAAHLFEQAGDNRSACLGHMDLGYALTEVGRHEEAVTVLRRTLHRSEQGGYDFVTAMLKNNLGLALGRLGQLEEACEFERDAVRAFEAQGDVRMSGASRYYLARALLLGGDLDRAEREARHAVDVLSELPSQVAVARSVLADVLMARGANEAALDVAKLGYDYIDGGGHVEEGEVIVRYAYAAALLACGRAEEAAAVAREGASQVQRRANKLSKDDLRQSFLANVRDNQRMLVLAESLAGK